MSTLGLDLLSLLFTLGPGLVAWGGLLGAWPALWAWHPWFAVVSAPFVLVAGLIFSLAAFRALVPRLRPGVHPAGWNRDFLAWWCQTALERAAVVSGLYPLVGAFSISRWLYFRALGARVAFPLHASLTAVLHDLPLLTAGRDTTLAERATVSCHVFTGDRLLLAPVTLGMRVFVGREAALGPKTSVGDGCTIGSRVQLSRKRVPAGAKLSARPEKSGAGKDGDEP